MPRRLSLGLLLALLVGTGAASAEQLEKGDRELQLAFSYNEIEFDEFGSSDTTELRGFFGYMLSDHHEVGLGLVYEDQAGSDALLIGGSYTYNFRAGEELNPYLALQIVTYEGDLGNLFDFAYGPEAGVKVYPWAHGGFLFGVNYREIEGARSGLDASQWTAFAGILLKF